MASLSDLRSELARLAGGELPTVSTGQQGSARGVKQPGGAAGGGMADPPHGPLWIHGTFEVAEAGTVQGHSSPLRLPTIKETKDSAKQRRKANIALQRQLPELRRAVDTIAMQDGAADLFRREGKYRDSIAALEKSLQMRIEVYGHDHVEVELATERIVSLANTFAMQLMTLGEFNAALQLLQRADDLTGRTSTLKQERRGSLRVVTLNNLACYYRRRRRLNAALQYIHKALKLETKAEDAENLAATRLNHGAVLSELGRHQEAIHEYRAAIAQLQGRLVAAEAEKLTIVVTGGGATSTSPPAEQLSTERVARRRNSVLVGNRLVDTTAAVDQDERSGCSTEGGDACGTLRSSLIVAFHNLATDLEKIGSNADASRCRRDALAMSRQHMGAGHALTRRIEAATHNDPADADASSALPALNRQARALSTSSSSMLRMLPELQERTSSAGSEGRDTALELPRLASDPMLPPMSPPPMSFGELPAEVDKRRRRASKQSRHTTTGTRPRTISMTTARPQRRQSTATQHSQGSKRSKRSSKSKRSKRSSKKKKKQHRQHLVGICEDDGKDASSAAEEQARNISDSGSTGSSSGSDDEAGDHVDGKTAAAAAAAAAPARGLAAVVDKPIQITPPGVLHSFVTPKPRSRDTFALLSAASKSGLLPRGITSSPTTSSLAAGIVARLNWEHSAPIARLEAVVLVYQMTKQEKLEMRSATTIQRTFRGHKSRQAVREKRKVETQAAVHIQRQVRGLHARRELQRRRHEAKVRREEDRAARHIQRVARGRDGRRRAAEMRHLRAQQLLREREEAAVRIQNNVRRLAARREAERLRAERELREARERSAVVIQCMVRVWMAKTLVAMLKKQQLKRQRDEAARNIQRVARGRAGRRTAAAQRRHAAAQAARQRKIRELLQVQGGLRKPKRLQHAKALLGEMEYVLEQCRAPSPSARAQTQARRTRRAVARSLASRVQTLHNSSGEEDYLEKRRARAEREAKAKAAASRSPSQRRLAASGSQRLGQGKKKRSRRREHARVLAAKIRSTLDSGDSSDEHGSGKTAGKSAGDLLLTRTAFVRALDQRIQSLWNEESSEDEPEPEPQSPRLRRGQSGTMSTRSIASVRTAAPVAERVKKPQQKQLAAQRSASMRTLPTSSATADKARRARMVEQRSASAASLATSTTTGTKAAAQATALPRAGPGVKSPRSNATTTATVTPRKTPAAPGKASNRDGVTGSKTASATPKKTSPSAAAGKARAGAIRQQSLQRASSSPNLRRSMQQPTPQRSSSSKTSAAGSKAATPKQGPSRVAEAEAVLADLANDLVAAAISRVLQDLHMTPEERLAALASDLVERSIVSVMAEVQATPTSVAGAPAPAATSGAVKQPVPASSVPVKRLALTLGRCASAPVLPTPPIVLDDSDAEDDCSDDEDGDEQQREPDEADDTETAPVMQSSLSILACELVTDALAESAVPQQGQQQDTRSAVPTSPLSGMAGDLAACALAAAASNVSQEASAFVSALDAEISKRVDDAITHGLQTASEMDQATDELVDEAIAYASRPTTSETEQCEAVSFTASEAVAEATAVSSPQLDAEISKRVDEAVKHGVRSASVMDKATDELVDEAITSGSRPTTSETKQREAASEDTAVSSPQLDVEINKRVDEAVKHGVRSASEMDQATDELVDEAITSGSRPTTSETKQFEAVSFTASEAVAEATAVPSPQLGAEISKRVDEAVKHGVRSASAMDQATDELVDEAITSGSRPTTSENRQLEAVVEAIVVPPPPPRHVASAAVRTITPAEGTVLSRVLSSAIASAKTAAMEVDRMQSQFVDRAIAEATETVSSITTTADSADSVTVCDKPSASMAQATDESVQPTSVTESRTTTGQARPHVPVSFTSTEAVAVGATVPSQQLDVEISKRVDEAVKHGMRSASAMSQVAAELFDDAVDSAIKSASRPTTSEAKQRPAEAKQRPAEATAVPSPQLDVEISKRVDEAVKHGMRSASAMSQVAAELFDDAVDSAIESASRPTTSEARQRGFVLPGDAFLDAIVATWICQYIQHHQAAEALADAMTSRLIDDALYAGTAPGTGLMRNASALSMRSGRSEHLFEGEDEQNSVSDDKPMHLFEQRDPAVANVPIVGVLSKKSAGSLAGMREGAPVSVEIGIGDECDDDDSAAMAAPMFRAPSRTPRESLATAPDTLASAQMQQASMHGSSGEATAPSVAAEGYDSDDSLMHGGMSTRVFRVEQQKEDHQPARRPRCVSKSPMIASPSQPVMLLDACDDDGSLFTSTVTVDAVPAVTPTQRRRRP